LGHRGLAIDPKTTSNTNLGSTGKAINDRNEIKNIAQETCTSAIIISLVSRHDIKMLFKIYGYGTVQGVD
jgi:hypothetical protein